MNILKELQDFYSGEIESSLPDISIYGYFPYCGYRRKNFENIVSAKGFEKISRKKIDKFDVLKRILNPFPSLSKFDKIVILSGGNSIPIDVDTCIAFSYYDDRKSEVKLETLRLLSHILAAFIFVFHISLLRYLRPAEVIRYVGDAIYYCWVKKIISITQVKSVFLTVSYSHYPVIAAARSLGIKVIEYQHGAISFSHVGYSGHINRYFPDEIVPLNNQWKKYIQNKNLPLVPTDMDCNWLKLLRAVSIDDFLEEVRKSKIVVIGQETVHAELMNIVNILKDNGADVVYRYHPRMQKSPLTLDEQLEDVDILVGSYSTVLVEYSKGRSVYLWDSPGLEFLDILLEIENVSVIKKN